LISCADEYISVEERKAEKMLSLETRMRFERTKPDGEFITGQLDDQPFQVQESLIKCLKANADVFATTPKEMQGIDTAVACHCLKVNSNMKYVAQLFVI
jgi:hypothetical protein